MSDISMKELVNLQFGNSAKSRVYRYIFREQVTTSHEIEVALDMRSQNVRNALFDLRKLKLITRDKQPRKYGKIRAVEKPAMHHMPETIIGPPYLLFNRSEYEEHWFSSDKNY